MSFKKTTRKVTALGCCSRKLGLCCFQVFIIFCQLFEFVAAFDVRLCCLLGLGGWLVLPVVMQGFALSATVVIHCNWVITYKCLSDPRLLFGVTIIFFCQKRHVRSWTMSAMSLPWAIRMQEPEPSATVY